MMSVQAVRVETTLKRERRLFRTDSPIANGVFYRLSRKALSREFVPTYWDDVSKQNLEMDEGTLKMIEQLFRCPAIHEMFISPNKVDVRISEQFRWSEVQPWVIRCIEECLGLPSSVDAVPEISRREIFTNRFPRGFVGSIFAITAMVSEESYTGIGLRGFSRDDMSRSHFDVFRAPQAIQRLIRQLFGFGEIGRISIHHTEVVVTLREPFSFTPELDRKIRLVLVEYLGWPVTEEILEDRVVTASSEDPIDTFENPTS